MRTLVVLRLNKATDSFWLNLLRNVEEKTFNEGATVTVATVGVKGYTLLDAQFVQVTVKVKDKDVVLLIPRNIVLTIVQAKTALDASTYFGPGSQKSGG